MTITHVVSASAQAINGGNPSVSLGGTLLQDDVAVIIAASGGGSPTPAMSTSGYTTLLTDSSLTTIVAWKRMGGTPDTTAVVTGTGGANDAVCASVIVLRGVNTTTAIDATTTSTESAGTNPNSPSITTVTDGAAVIALMGTNVNDAAITAPSGYGNHTTINSNDTNSETTAAAWLLKATAGAENPPGWTNVASSGYWVAVTVALRPEPAGGQPFIKRMGGVPFMAGARASQGSGIW